MNRREFLATGAASAFAVLPGDDALQGGHDFYDAFAHDFPRVHLRRGLRFVESAPNLATAGGLTSGIDLALRTVERCFGRGAAQQTADYLEYAGTGWRTS